MKKEYGENSITSLKDEQQVRQRPAVIFGTDNEEGCLNGVKEIIANAVDEAREGYGELITFKVCADNSIEVTDEGRGVPMGWNEGEKEWNWKLVFCTLYASGKYDSDAYGLALGLNGLGATAMQYASEYMCVESVSNGKLSVMKFEKGRPVGQLSVTDTDRKSGTKIKFKPDEEVFTSTEGMVTAFENYADLFRSQAMLHPGLKFRLIHEAENLDVIIQFKGGIKDFLDSAVKRSMLQSGSMVFEDALMVNNEKDEKEGKPPFKLQMRLVMNFSRHTQFQELYHNGSLLTEGGTTRKALEYAITATIEKHGRDIGKFGKNERILFKDIESVLSFVGDTNAPGNRTAFKNQTKKAIENKVFQTEYSKFITNKFKLWLESHKEEADRIITEVKNNKTAREQGEQIQRKVINSMSKNNDYYGNFPKKFVNCLNKSPMPRELYIVEGDSALGACKQARDSALQALIPVRGKIINCLKNPLSKILSSEIIIDLWKVFGCGLEIESETTMDLGLAKFSLSKLKWDKVVICTDADVDGMQIRALILTAIYRLTPSLLKAGRVYIAETPLYEIAYKGDSIFAYSDKEKDMMVEKICEHMGITANKLTVQRSKGLGENDPEMLSQTTMKPETRRLTAIAYPQDEEALAKLFESLLGEDLLGRREYISQYFKNVSSLI